MSRLHRRTHDIYGNSLKFHSESDITLDTTNNDTETVMNLNFKFIHIKHFHIFFG